MFDILDQKLQFTYPSQASIKDAQATGEAVQPSKENIQPFKKQFCTFFYFCGSFLPSWIRIRIQQLKLMRIRNPEGGREEGRRRWRGSGLRTRGQLRQQRAGPGGGAHRRVQGSTVVIYLTSVPDPNPHVFGPLGSGSRSTSQRYGSGSRSGSGSFCHQAKIVRKTSYCFVSSFGLFIFASLLLAS